jgi:hypothetical protein
MRPFDAQDALTSMIEALQEDSLSGWTVDCGLPSRRDERHVWVHDDVEGWSLSDLVTGQVMGEESFTLSIYVYSRRLDSTFTEQRDEVGDAGDAIKAAITSDPTLDGTVSRAHVSGARYEGAYEDEDGRVRYGVLRIEVEVNCWA